MSTTQAQEAAPTQTGQEQTASDETITLPLDAKGAEQALSDGLKISRGESPTVEQQSEKEEAPPAEGVQPPPVEGESAGQPPVETPPTEGQQQRILPNRISTAQFSADEQEAIKLRKQLRDEGNDVTLQEALGLVEDRQKKSSTTAPKAQQEDPEAVVQAELVKIEADLERATESELFTKEVRSALDRKAELREQLRDIQSQKRQQESQIRTERMSARERVKQEVLQQYPSADDANSELGKEVASLIAEMKDEAHPDHGVLFTEKAPKFVVQEAAERLAKRMAETGKTTVDEAIAKLRAPQKPPQGSSAASPQQQQRKVSPSSGALGAITTGKPITEQELLAAVGTNPQLADEVLGGKQSGWVIQ